MSSAALRWTISRGTGVATIWVYAAHLFQHVSIILLQKCGNKRNNISNSNNCITIVVVVVLYCKHVFPLTLNITFKLYITSE